MVPTPGQLEHTFGVLMVSPSTTATARQWLKAMERRVIVEAITKGPLAPLVLEALAQDFAALRAAGLKALLRFRYSSSSNAAVSRDPPAARVAAQLAPLVVSASDGVADDDYILTAAPDLMPLSPHYFGDGRARLF